MHQSPQKINLPRYQLRASGATSGTASGFDLGFFNIQRGVFAQWLNQPIWKICASQIASFPEVEKHIWNHNLVIVTTFGKRFGSNTQETQLNNLPAWPSLSMTLFLAKKKLSHWLYEELLLFSFG